MVNKMKKRMGMFALCALASVTLAGCSGEISDDRVTISQYKGLEVTKVESTEVTDEDVESEIEYMLNNTAEEKVIKKRAAKTGDTVNIDYVGKKDGEAFDGGTAEGYDLELGSGSFIDGFEDGIVGHKTGDQFELNLTFPEDYGTSELAGQDVVFEVTLNQIKEVTVPELTDEWVVKNSEESKTVEEYKKELKADMVEYYENAAKSELATEVWSAFTENITVNSYDTEELQNLIKQTRKQYEDQAESYEMEFDEFLETYLGMDEDTFNAEVSTLAKDQLKEQYATALVIEKENLDVSEEKLRAVYETYLDYFGAEDVDSLIESMEEAGYADSLEQLGKAEIVRNYLVDHCKQVEAKETDTETDTQESSAE